MASNLPALVECDSILQDKREIPTPELARFPHLQGIADELPPFDSDANIHLLIEVFDVLHRFKGCSRLPPER